MKHFLKLRERQRNTYVLCRHCSLKWLLFTLLILLSSTKILLAGVAVDVLDFVSRGPGENLGGNASNPLSNNDNDGTASVDPVIENNGIILPEEPFFLPFNVTEVEKRLVDNTVNFLGDFNFGDPFDIIFTVVDSGGVTDQFFIERVLNDTSHTWLDYHFALGFGSGDNFVLSSPDDGLDFDFPDKDPTPSNLVQIANVGGYDDTDTPVFGTLNHMADEIWWSGGALAPGEEILFSFSIDVPDFNENMPDFAEYFGGYTFTLRQLPTTTGTVIPEPSTLMLIGLGLIRFLVKRN
ncbi:MAG: PEP-CTERM sorting domain-containing protein [Candidatus Omnitrophica bacterium]|nr:PEP-CTERM sorting domain-containing protein [Candidatus Omnitrophota bacterium]